MRRMNKEQQREIEEYFVADKLIVCTYQNNATVTNVECIVVRNYAQELRNEIISYCEKHYRYAG